MSTAPLRRECGVEARRKASLISAPDPYTGSIHNILCKKGWMGSRIGVDIEANLKRPAPDENRIPVTLSVASHFADSAI